MINEFTHLSYEDFKQKRKEYSEEFDKLPITVMAEDAIGPERDRFLVLFDKLWTASAEEYRRLIDYTKEKFDIEGPEEILTTWKKNTIQDFITCIELGYAEDVIFLMSSEVGKWAEAAKKALEGKQK